MKAVEHDITWVVSKRKDEDTGDTVYTLSYTAYVANRGATPEDEKVLKAIKESIPSVASDTRDDIEAAIIADVKRRCVIA